MRLYCVHALLVLLIRNYDVSSLNLQFHQDDYDIEQDRIDVLNYNKAIVPYLDLKVFKYNDTLKMKAINLTVKFVSNVRKHFFLTFAVFKSVSKIYRPLPIPNVTLDVCEEFRNLGDSNPFGIRTVISKSNFKGCPVAPGVYYIDTWILEQDKFPPHAPVGQYKIYIYGSMDDISFGMDAVWYGSIIRKKKKKH